MKRILKYILLTIFLSSATDVWSQDYHFSQFYAMPLALNPALTGNLPEDYRISAIYRNQWSRINSAFETSAIGFDMNFKSKKLKGDKLGAGIYVYKDNLGSNIITAQAAMLSVASHHPLDVHRRHNISGGIQLGFVQKSINFSKLDFADQYEDFILSKSTNETFSDNQIGYASLNLGMSYTFRISPKTDVLSGLSLFQINTPKESFYASSSRLNARWTGYAGANYKFSPLVTISPRVLYVNHENGMDINPGAYVGYHLGTRKEITLYGGAWYRINDAAIVMVGGKWKNYTLRFSYDGTVSGFRQVKNANNLKGSSKTGGFEISFVMVGKLSRAYPDAYTIPCGIF